MTANSMFRQNLGENRGNFGPLTFIERAACVAHVELISGTTVTEDVSRRFYRRHMAGSGTIGDQPKTSTGKIQKFAPAELAKSANTIQ